MLELRSYKKAELAAIVGTNDRQGIERKLQRNKVVCVKSQTPNQKGGQVNYNLSLPQNQGGTTNETTYQL